MMTEPVSVTGTTAEWTTAPLAVLDLEGSGAQDHVDAAILEIAVVPVTAGQPDISAAYTTLVYRHLPAAARGQGLVRHP